MTILLRIADRVLNRPLLVHPDKVPFILSVLQGRIPLGDLGELRAQAEWNIEQLPEEARAAITGPRREASRFVGSAQDVDPATGAVARLPYKRTSAGVAIIPVLGSLVNRGAWLGSNSGETSYEGVKFQIAAAAADPRATSILLDIESPGGEAVGAFEAADAVRAAAAVKPVVAVVNGMAASAAYALASGASRIVTTPTGVNGSIGVVLLHADYSRALDKQGVTPTLIFAGAHKVDGHPFGPLSDGVREDLQREVNQFYDLFVQTVASGRRQMSPAAIRDTEARVFIGAEAVANGLADSVGTFEEVLADLSRGSSGRVATSNRTGANMDNAKGAPAAESTGISKADHDTAVAKAFADGKAAGKTEANAAHATELATQTAAATLEGATAERARILGIETIAVAGHDALVAEMKADGKTSPADAAMRILAAEKVTRGKNLQAIKDVETEGSKVPAVASAQGTQDPPKSAKATTPEQWKAEYAADPKLQAEFTAAEPYAAYMQAETSGKVRRLVNRST